MQQLLNISSKKITLEDIFVFFDQDFSLVLGSDSIEAVTKCREYLESKLESGNELYYGVNTGFGSLCDTRISEDEIGKLQYNLVVSHACGVGDEVPIDIARLILLLKIKNLSYGYSGVTLELVNKMVEVYNSKITPVIYQQGSLGASGDLAPLAHMSLPLLGKGVVWFDGNRMSAEAALKEIGIEAVELKAKEGLALLNGTQFSLAYAIHGIYHAHKIIESAIMIAALSMEAYACGPGPLDEGLHRIRKQKGQQVVAEKLRRRLSGSTLIDEISYSVQDPYSFRCTPQVLGASLDTINHASEVIEIELNAVTDNPSIFPDEDKILSGGNFHGQPLALIMDYLAIALSEISNISERRMYQLIGGSRDLPPYLTRNPGLHSGLMITQYTAASVVSQNKQLCSPASVDSIVSSAGQEDHVSMSSNSGTKLFRVVENVYKVLAIELLAACQALEFRKKSDVSQSSRKLYSDFRNNIPALNGDRILSADIHQAIEFIKDRKTPIGPE